MMYMSEGHAVHWEPFIVEREQDQTRRPAPEALTIQRVEECKGQLTLTMACKLAGSSLTWWC